MQETATYRQCHYMGANEPCAEDLIPKNRQNNVYGHGHVNAQPALIEAAEMSYSFNNNLSVNVTTAAMMDNHIHLNPGEHIDIELNTPVDTIQWRSNHLRDNWANLHSYDHQTGAELTHTDITHQLEHLPGIELQGNHSISIRAISGTTSSPLVTVDIMLMGEMLDDSEGPASSSGIGTVAWLGISSFLGVILFTIGMVIGRNQIEEAELVE
jgi:hypothetical protein